MVKEEQEGQSPRLDPRVRKIPGEAGMANSTPVSLSEELADKEPGRLLSMGSQRADATE